MANNLVVQLLLKTGTFSTDLKTARGQVQNFQKGCQTAGKSLDAFGKAIGIDIGALTKFGGAVGIAVAAGKGLKAVIDSNQKSADFFQSAMYSAKTAVDELAYSIGTFDFSNFQDGLSGLIRRAREAAGAIDQLGNTLMSYNVIQAKARLSISQAKAIINDPNSTKEQVEEAKKVMKESMDQMRQSASVLLDDYKTALIAEVNAKGAKMTGEGAVDILDMWLTADAMGNRDAIKDKAKKDYEAYQKAVATLATNPDYQKDVVIGTTMYGGTMWGKGLDTTNPEYQASLAALNKQYESAIAYNVLLEKYSDEQLQKLGQQRVAMIQTEQTLADMTTQMEKVENKTLKTTSSSTKSVKEENTALEGSLEYWKKIQQESQKHRDMEVFNSTAWKTYDQALQDAIRHIQMLESLLKRYQNQQPGEKGNKVGIPDNAPVGKAESGVKMGLNGATTPEALSADEIKSHIAFLEKERDAMKEGNPQIATHNSLIKDLGERLNKIQGVEVPAPDKKDTDKWDTFNSAMANTATIVDAVASSFQDGMKLTTASILKMVSTSLPALSTLIGTLATLAGVEATEKAVQTSRHWIEAIAAVAALGATVAAALAAAKKGGKFANGGIVGGSSFTGDRVTAQVNSGEMILNKAQQARLFKIANGGATGGQVEFHISGTELVGVLNNANRKNNLIR